MHCTVLGGLYPGAEVVERVLAYEWGVEKAILDVGTGPGHWAIDMAKRFPHCHVRVCVLSPAILDLLNCLRNGLSPDDRYRFCQVVGVDLAPRTSIPTLPDNLRLEFDDVSTCMLLYHRSLSGSS